METPPWCPKSYYLSWIVGVPPCRFPKVCSIEWWLLAQPRGFGHLRCSAGVTDGNGWQWWKGGRSQQEGYPSEALHTPNLFGKPAGRKVRNLDKHVFRGSNGKAPNKMVDEKQKMTLHAVMALTSWIHLIVFGVFLDHLLSTNFLRSESDVPGSKPLILGMVTTLE